ncbi:unnamed protein product [Aphanomyces euteiches]|uniref:Uncharacterized protein n=1 Tax=Aphanomyces euteiches TaxID=100861 RepID=A0A6G0WIT2_9STRA|nr:hypothetical protein Ae201684_014848 [Aphanomyces euteiches]KAH9072655.1 hypothetical protein Ae201684P_015728 [Aphanomyces euteiches]KAH9147715.1 hypothetical protein AeRB84_008737 [Aphanomyces euteiches]
MAKPCRVERCRRYSKTDGLCLYHSRDAAAKIQEQQKLQQIQQQQQQQQSNQQQQQQQQQQKDPAHHRRWVAITKVRYHHTGWIKCLVPQCPSEAKRHFALCAAHEQSVVCVHERTRQYLTPDAAPVERVATTCEAQEMAKRPRMDSDSRTRVPLHTQIALEL